MRDYKMEIEAIKAETAKIKKQLKQREQLINFLHEQQEQSLAAWNQFKADLDKLKGAENDNV